VTAGVDEVSIVPLRERMRSALVERAGVSRRKATMAVLLSGVFTVHFAITLLVVVLDTVAKDLDTTVSVVSWSITAPMLMFAVIGPAFGTLGDLVGHKRVFVGGLLGAGIFAGLAAIAPNAPLLIVLRTLSAACGSATGPSAMAFTNRMFAPHERVRPLGMWSFVTAGAPVIGVVAGVPLVELVGWRVIFLIQAPLCVLGALTSWWLLRDTERQPHARFDAAGALTLGGGAALLLLGINRGSSWGWTSPMIVSAIIIGLMLLVAFVQVERRVAAPMVPPAWFRTRNIAFPVLSQSLANFAYMGGFMILPQMLKDGVGLSLATVGWLIIARPLTFAIAAPLGARVTMRTGERFAGMFGSMTVFTSMIVLSTIREGTPLWVIAFGLGLSGLGLGVASPALSALLANAVRDHELGIASAMQQLISQMGALLGATVMITVHEATLDDGVLSSYANALVIGASLCVVAGLLAGEVRSTDRSGTDPDPAGSGVTGTTA
jgi:MFS family permease